MDVMLFAKQSITIKIREERKRKRKRKGSYIHLLSRKEIKSLKTKFKLYQLKWTVTYESKMISSKLWFLKLTTQDDLHIFMINQKAKNKIIKRMKNRIMQLHYEQKQRTTPLESSKTLTD